VEIARKVIGRRRRHLGGRAGAFDVTLDAVLLPSPYASSFAGFVELTTSLWFGVGGVLGSLWNEVSERRAKGRTASGEKQDELPEDMSTTSLVGGGLIAGDALAALILGIMGLVASGALGAFLK
jgi:hypothetical protein